MEAGYEIKDEEFSYISGSTKSHKKMDYQEHCQELDTKIRSIQKMEPFGCYTLDGIVNVENWRKQQIRPLFIGKEPHGTGYDQEVWSMANWLNENPKEDACDATPHTWPKTAYISYALQNGFAQYDDMPHINQDKKIAEALRHIAFINVGKYTAETTTPWPRLNELYRQNRNVLHDQIEMLQPNVIVGWNTLGLFENDEEFMSRFALEKSDSANHDIIDSWTSGGKLFISAYHPGSRTSFVRYVDSIVTAVKEHIEDIDLSLPTL